MNTKTHTSLSYLVCPITGLSVSFQDDYDSTQLAIHRHPLTSHPLKLYSLIRKHGSESTFPKSYIVAGVLLKLTENEMIAHPELEPEYLRGQIVTYLEQEHRHTLIKLFWATYNSQAPLKLPGTEFKITLSQLTSYHSHRPMTALLFAVANQEFSYEDTVYNSSKSTGAWSKLSLQGSTKHIDQDPISARNRVHKNLTKVLKMVGETEAQMVIEHPGKEISGIYASRREYKAISLLRPYLLDYHNCSVPVRQQLGTLLKDTLTLSLRYSLLDQDEPLAKSFQIVIDLVLGFEADPIEMSLDEEW